jgi:hypothetical protein
MVLAGGLWLLAPGVLVPLAFGHDAQCVSAALIPLTLLAAHDRCCRAPTPRSLLATALGLALSLAAQVLGAIRSSWSTPRLVLAAFAIERALAFGGARRLWAVSGACALGALMSAGLWLPALAFGAHAQRAAPRIRRARGGDLERAAARSPVARLAPGGGLRRCALLGRAARDRFFARAWTARSGSGRVRTTGARAGPPRRAPPGASWRSPACCSRSVATCPGWERSSSHCP